MWTRAPRPRRGVLCCPSQTTKETQQIIYNGIYFQQKPKPELMPHDGAIDVGLGDSVWVGSCQATAWIAFLLSLKTPQPLRSTHTAVCKAANREDQYLSFTLAWPRHLSCVSVPALDVAATSFQGIFEIFDAGFWIGRERLSSQTLNQRLKHFRTHVRILLCFPVWLVLRRKGIFE